AALHRHLQEFPAVSNGLGRTDRQVLQLIADGIDRPGCIFAANIELEMALFLGDWGLYRHIHDLCNVAGLLDCRPHGEFRGPLDPTLSKTEFGAQQLSLSARGRQVLANEADACAFGAADRWLGGVHFTDGNANWRWDEPAGRLTRVEA